MNADAWLGVIGALVGVIGTLLGTVIGWRLNERSRLLAERRTAQEELDRAAFACLDRLRKIHGAMDSTDDEQRDGETTNLGADLDRYRDCIATAKARRSVHWRAYESARPILLHHRFEGITEVINEFERLAEVDDD
jgi:hypothetical protein